MHCKRGWGRSHKAECSCVCTKCSCVCKGQGSKAAGCARFAGAILEGLGPCERVCERVWRVVRLSDSHYHYDKYHLFSLSDVANYCSNKQLRAPNQASLPPHRCCPCFGRNGGDIGRPTCSSGCEAQGWLRRTRDLSPRRGMPPPQKKYSHMRCSSALWNSDACSK